MSSKTKEQIAQDLITEIQTNVPDADTTIGTVLRDVSVDPVAATLELAYTEQDTIRYSNSINYISSQTDDQVDNLAANWGLVRLAATYSYGTITFRSITQPSTSIRIGNIVGTGGVIVSTQKNTDGSYYSYQTTSTVYLEPTTPYNPSTGYYEVTAPIVSISSGLASNVSSGSIIVFSGLTGVDSITNILPTLGGSDTESNTTLGNRIIMASQARLLGTAPGYETLVSSITGVTDVAVVTSNDAEVLRNATGNEIDIVIVGDSITTGTQVEVFNNVSGLTIYLDSLPITSVNSIAGMTNGFVSGVDFQFAPDTSSDYYNTNQSYDKIVWLNGGAKPFNGENYTISYSYNKLIGDVQAELDLTTNKLIASDVLVRQGTEVIIDISLTATIYSGTSKDYAQSQIVTALTTYIESLSLGSIIEQADLVFSLKTTLSFIDNIVIPFTKLCRRSVGTGTTDIQLKKLEYPIVDNNSFTITVR